tara:strand:+ start:554 stop:859 length:306 start_codon:yes stop_codon:yes gene_type:complete
MQKNITGETNQELIAPDSRINVSSIRLTNVGDTYGHYCNVDLFIQSCLGTFYFLKNKGIGHGESIDINNISFNNQGTNSFGLYAKLTKVGTQTPAVDIITM